MTSVVLADDHPLLLRGLHDLLETAPDFTVAAATGDGREALERIRQLRPDIAVLDLAMGSFGGLDIQQALVDDRLPVRVVLLTATLTDRQIATSLSLGVSGLMLKESAPDALLDCLRRVAGGGSWLPDELLARSGRQAGTTRTNALTPREREIAELICAGCSNRVIADRLNASEGTIGIHLQNIYRKLKISNRTMLAALYLQNHVEQRV